MDTNDLERIHLTRINKVSSNIIDAFRAFNHQEYYDVLLKVHLGYSTSEQVASDETISISRASSILSELKNRGILKVAKQKDGRYNQYSFDRHMMRKIKNAAKLNW